MEGGDFKLLLNSAIHDFVCCPTIFDKDLYHQRGVRVYKLLTVVNEFLEASQMVNIND